MEDIIAYALKIILILIAVWQLYKGNLLALMFVSIPLFMAGVEMVTDNDSPWTYLFSNTATPNDFKKALLGGMVGISVLGIMFAVAQKDLTTLSRHSLGRGRKSKS